MLKMNLHMLKKISRQGNSGIQVSSRDRFRLGGTVGRSMGEEGIVLPIALTFVVVLTTLGLALMQTSILAQSSTIRHSYVQMAHIASKAAIDYAEEQYELDSDYDGTSEQDLVVTDKYRITIEVDILYQESSTSQRVQAFGRVYIPESDADADYVRDIKASIIRNGEVIVVEDEVDPASYDPFMWVAADQPNSLIKPSLGDGNQYIAASYGSGYSDVVEQKGADANRNPGQLQFGNDDLEMSWDGSNSGHQSIGVRFRGLDTPQGQTVSQAYIQFQTDETKNSQPVRLLVQGVATDDAGSWQGYYAVDNAPKTTANVDWEPPAWNVVGASGDNERVEVTSIVQEIVNRPGWSPGNDIAFAISYVEGSGVRTAEKGRNNVGNPVLYVDWSTVAGNEFATQTGDQVETWIDKSLNNNNLITWAGSHPTLVTDAINGLPALRFSQNSSMRSLLSSTKYGYGATVFMVMSPRSGSNDSRYLSLQDSNQSTDWNNSYSVVMLSQDGLSDDIEQVYDGYLGSRLNNVVDDGWAVFSSRISDIWVERLLKNGYENYQSNSWWVYLAFDEVYLGGRRNGSNPANYANMDVAEVIAYDRALDCSEMDNIESYLGSKYGISPIGVKCP